jgi:hypothetical protein
MSGFPALTQADVTSPFNACCPERRWNAAIRRNQSASRPCGRVPPGAASGPEVDARSRAKRNMPIEQQRTPPRGELSEPANGVLGVEGPLEGHARPTSPSAVRFKRPSRLLEPLRAVSAALKQHLL